MPRRTLADDLGYVTPAEAAHLGEQLAAELERRHRRKRVHGAIDPSAVRYETDGRVTLRRRRHPSVGFASPQVARGLRATPADDVWALGAVLYAAVDGLPPHAPGTDAEVIRRTVHQPVPAPRRAGPATSAVMAAVHEIPDARPAAAELARTFAVVAALTGAHAPVIRRRAWWRPTPHGQVSSEQFANRTLAAFCLSFVLLSAVIVADATLHTT